MLPDLLNQALLGTQRQASATPQVGDEQLSALLAPLQAQPPEIALLCTAGVLAAYRAAGVTALQCSDVPPAPAPDETLTECSARAAVLLDRVLLDSTNVLLRQWLEQAIAAGRRAPASHLVELLSVANSRSNLSGLVGQVVGERGKWLAAQNPQWNKECVGAHDVNAWTEGAVAVRVSYLRDLRSKDPAGGRALLDAAWKQEPARERAQFAGVLEEGLSMDDEPFLEQALDDRSKEVRGVVASLLSRLPHSRFSLRMQERAIPLISVEKKLLGSGTLHVQLPEAIDDTMKRDALEERLVAADVGKKASILYQIVASAPLTFWGEKYGLEPGVWLKLARKSDWEGPLVLGWVEAAILQQNVQWLQAMLDGSGSKVLKDATRRSSLLKALPEDLRRATLLALLEAGELDDSTLLHGITSEWDAELSRAALKQFVAPLAAKKSQAHYGIRERLRLLATRLHPGTFAEAEELTKTAELEINTRDMLSDFLELYRLRCEILSEFSR